MNKLDLFTKTIIGLVFLSSSYAAHSAILEIQFTGLDLVYDGFSVYDAGGIDGGLGDPATADPLSVMIFEVDGTEVGRLETDIFADLIIDGVDNIPVAGGTVTTGSGFFDLLTSSANPGWGLALEFDEATISYVVGGGFEIAIFGAAASTICTVDPCFQALPFNLEMGDPVTFTFSSSNFDTNNNEQVLTDFTASSDGTITGSLVPVPAAVWLFGSGLIGLVGIARRKTAA